MTYCFIKIEPLEPGDMMISTDSKHFADICSKISLNIPSTSQWSWDNRLKTAMVVFDKGDMDVVYIPIAVEFDTQWDFKTIENSPPHFCEFFKRVFGIIPGQKIFASSDGSGTILFAVWWPWGDGNKISLRVGIYNVDDATDPNLFKKSLSKWLQIKDQNLTPNNP
jgi:hypothetical protein